MDFSALNRAINSVSATSVAVETALAGLKI